MSLTGDYGNIIVYNEDKRYYLILPQRNKPLLDTELRHMDKARFDGIRRAFQSLMGDVASPLETYSSPLSYANNAFKVTQANDTSFGLPPLTPTSNNFAIIGGDGTKDSAGVLFAYGIYIYFKGAILYKEQNATGTLSDDDYTKTAIPSLFTPLSGPRTDIVYMDLSFDEAGSKPGTTYEDPELMSPTIGTDTANRLRAVIDIRVQEGWTGPTDSSIFSDSFFGYFPGSVEHYKVPIAILNRLDNQPHIDNSQIVDLLTRDEKRVLTPKEITWNTRHGGATGLGELWNDVGQNQGFSNRALNDNAVTPRIVQDAGNFKVGALVAGTTGQSVGVTNDPNNLVGGEIAATKVYTNNLYAGATGLVSDFRDIEHRVYVDTLGLTGGVTGRDSGVAVLNRGVTGTYSYSSGSDLLDPDFSVDERGFVAIQRARADYPLDVDGTARIGTLLANSFIVDNLHVNQNAEIGGTLGVTGLTTHAAPVHVNASEGLDVRADASSGNPAGVIASFGVKTQVDPTYPGYIYFSNINTINFGYNVNATATGHINYHGYQNAGTQTRDLQISDGNSNSILYLTGASKLAALSGALTVFGTVTVGPSGSGNPAAETADLTITAGSSGDATSSLTLRGFRTVSGAFAYHYAYHGSNLVGKTQWVRDGANDAGKYSIYTRPTSGALTERFFIDSVGAATLTNTLTVASLVGIGGAIASNVGLNQTSTDMTGANQVGIQAGSTFQSTATSSGTALDARLKTAAFVLPTGTAIRIDTPLIGGSVTNVYGLYIDNQTGGTGLNYAIYTNAGDVRIGGSVLLSSTLQVTGLTTHAAPVHVNASEGLDVRADAASGNPAGVIAYFGGSASLNSDYPGYIYFSDLSNINFGYNVNNDNATGVINFHGFHNGITRNRNFYIYDGKESAILEITGTSKLSQFRGAVKLDLGLVVDGDASFSNAAVRTYDSNLIFLTPTFNKGFLVLGNAAGPQLQLDSNIIQALGTSPVGATFYLNPQGGVVNISKSGVATNILGSLTVAQGITFNGLLTAAAGISITTVGLTVVAGGIGVTAGGLTVTAGGLTVTAGGLTVDAGDIVSSTTGQIISRVTSGIQIALKNTGTGFGTITNDSNGSWSLGFAFPTSSELIAAVTKALTWTAGGFVSIPSGTLTVLSNITSTSGNISANTGIVSGLSGHFDSLNSLSGVEISVGKNLLLTGSRRVYFNAITASSIGVDTGIFLFSSSIPTRFDTTTSFAVNGAGLSSILMNTTEFLYTGPKLRATEKFVVATMFSVDPISNGGGVTVTLAGTNLSQSMAINKTAVEKAVETAFSVLMSGTQTETGAGGSSGIFVSNTAIPAAASYSRIGVDVTVSGLNAAATSGDNIGVRSSVSGSSVAARRNIGLRVVMPTSIFTVDYALLADNGEIAILGSGNIRTEQGNIYTTSGTIFTTLGDIYATSGNIQVNGNILKTFSILNAATNGGVATTFAGNGPTGIAGTNHGWFRIYINNTLSYVPFWQ